MSLVTRCPRCNTLYRVVPAQLQERGGRVRCGRCMNVFDGFDHLAVETPNAISEPVRFDPPETPAPAEKVEAASAAVEKPSESTADPFVTPRKPVGLRAREFAAERLAVARAKVAQPPSAAAKRAAICAGLALVLAGQLVYAFRSELAARYPALRVVLSGVCSVAGCKVVLPQRPDLVKIEASDVHMVDPGKPALIQVTATLRSYASYDLAYPALDLVLTNANEHALARRIFVPEEYLADTRDPKAGIPPRAEITVALDLDTGDLNAAGFRLDLIAAPTP